MIGSIVVVIDTVTNCVEISCRRGNGYRSLQCCMVSTAQTSHGPLIHSENEMNVFIERITSSNRESGNKLVQLITVTKQAIKKVIRETGYHTKYRKRQEIFFL